VTSFASICEAALNQTSLVLLEGRCIRDLHKDPTLKPLIKAYMNMPSLGCGTDATVTEDENGPIEAVSTRPKRRIMRPSNWEDYVH